ncbi:MAG: hypothetical protein JWM35_2560 [Verrucomicrobia bacterium]|nr:hypothetical protein [Verrucomicrobiota bacterium]
MHSAGAVPRNKCGMGLRYRRAYDRIFRFGRADGLKGTLDVQGSRLETGATPGLSANAGLNRLRR